MILLQRYVCLAKGKKDPDDCSLMVFILVVLYGLFRQVTNEKQSVCHSLFIYLFIYFQMTSLSSTTSCFQVLLLLDKTHPTLWPGKKEFG